MVVNIPHTTTTGTSNQHCTKLHWRETSNRLRAERRPHCATKQQALPVTPAAVTPALTGVGVANGVGTAVWVGVANGVGVVIRVGVATGVGTWPGPVQVE